jgi:hypothetical protein
MGVAISSSSAAPPSIIQPGGAVWVQSPMFNFTVAKFENENVSGSLFSRGLIPMSERLAGSSVI